MSDKNYGYVALSEAEKEYQQNPHHIRNGCMEPKPLAQMIKDALNHHSQYYGPWIPGFIAAQLDKAVEQIKLELSGDINQKRKQDDKSALQSLIQERIEQFKAAVQSSGKYHWQIKRDWIVGGRNIVKHSHLYADIFQHFNSSEVD